MISPADTLAPTSDARSQPYAAGERGPQGHAEPPDPLADLTRSLSELQEFASQHVAARIDRIKLSVRQAVLYGVLGLVAGLVGLTVLITAAVMLLRGLALALAELLGDRQWAGDLIVAAVVLIAAGIGVKVVLGRLTHSSRQRTIDKYERRRNAQRVAFGFDAQSRARSK